MGTDITHHGRTDIGADIEHGHEQSTHGQRGIGSRFPNLLHDPDKFAKALQRIILALDRDQDFIRRRQCIGHQDTERGGAIHNDELELAGITHWLENTAQLAQMPLHPGDFNLGSSQIKVRGDAVKILQARLADQLLHGGLAYYRRVEAPLGADLQSQRTRGIPLGIKIQQENGVPGLRNGGGQVH